MGNWLNRRQQGIIAAFFLIFVIAVLSILISYNWIPFPSFLTHPLILGILAAVAFIVLFGWLLMRYMNSGTPDYDFGRRQREKQLSDEEAFELLRFLLLYRRNIRIGSTVERGSEKVKPEGDTESVRLYKLVFERVNVNERVGILLDCEQEFSINTESMKSLDSAADQVDNMQMVRGSKVDNFEEAVSDAKSSLGRSLDQQIVTKEFDDEGNVIQEKTVPARVLAQREQGQPALPQPAKSQRDSSLNGGEN